MKPLLDVLVILDALEKEGSFAAASAKLYKTPSALSYTIQKLESDLNIQLLDRSGHRARFTRTGQMLLEKGREVLHTARELEKQAVKLHQGWENALVLAWMHLSRFAAGAADRGILSTAAADPAAFREPSCWTGGR
jgi:DNA-binding transcriptional LysR family regulator